MDVNEIISVEDSIYLVDEMLRIRKDRMQIKDCLAVSQIVRAYLASLPDDEGRRIRTELDRRQLERVSRYI